MSNIKKYNLFIMISTIARNIVEVFSSVLLYKMGYSLKEILLFFTILYFVGGIISVIVIYLTKYINAKYILILSSIIFSISFYFMSTMDKTISNLIIFSIIYGIGSYSYHSLRHYFAIKTMDKERKKEIKENEDFIYDDIVNLKLNVLRDTLFLYEVDDPLEYINYEIYYYNDKFYVNAKREDINLIENSNLVYGDIVYKIIGRGIKI